MLSTDGTVSNSQTLQAVITLQQQMNTLINLLIPEGSSRQTGVKLVKSSTSSTERKSDEPAGELLQLLKTTQQRVNFLENEFEKVESENLHQDLGLKIY